MPRKISAKPSIATGTFNEAVNKSTNLAIIHTTLICISFWTGDITTDHMDILISAATLLSTWCSVMTIRRLRDRILENYEVVEFDREEYMDYVHDQMGSPRTLRATLEEQASPPGKKGEWIRDWDA